MRPNITESLTDNT